MNIEKLLLEVKKTHFKVLRDNRVPLTKEERDEVMRSGAVWHNSFNGKKIAGVWKSKRPDGSFVYVCNTHRAMQEKPTLKGAIKAFDFIKTTS